MARNPISFSSRTYQTILTDLELAYPNRPAWFKEIIAGHFDIAHWYLDARAQNLLLASAFTPEAVRNLAAMLDYTPNVPTPGGGDITVTINPVAPITVPKADLKFTVTGADGSSADFEATADMVIASGITGTASVLEGQTHIDSSIGTSDGITEFQEFILPDTDVLLDTVTLTVNSVLWTRKDTLVNSTGSDLHFVVIVRPDDSVVVQFGNGTYGAIPGNFPVLATYRTGGGVIGNIAQSGSNVSYTGSNTDIISAVMAADFSGGSAGETLETTRDMAPRMLRSNYRAVTDDDFETLARRFSSSIILAQPLPGLYGAGTVAVHIVPAGGGAPSSALKTQLEAYLRDRSTLRSADVRVRDPLYQTENITAAIKMRSGFSFSANLNYATLVCRLLVSELAREIIDLYNDPVQGISAAIAVINTKWGYSFTSTDYNEIARILLRRSREGTVDWGNSLRRNDIISALDDLSAVETETLAVPAGDVNVPFTQILTDGTVTVTEIL